MRCKSTKPHPQRSCRAQVISVAKIEHMKTTQALESYLREMGVSASGRGDGFFFIDAKEKSSMVSTWTDILAAERQESGDWVLHVGGFEVLGTIHAMDGVELEYDDDDEPIIPTIYKGEPVIGTVDGEFMLADNYISDDSSAPFSIETPQVAYDFLDEHDWVLQSDSEKTWDAIKNLIRADVAQVQTQLGAAAKKVEVEVATLTATHTVGLVWIWHVYLTQEPNSTFTLSAEQVNFDGPPETIEPEIGISSLSALTVELVDLWNQMTGDAPDQNVFDDTLFKVFRHFPSLT
jgi:hypothetical protein